MTGKGFVVNAQTNSERAKEIAKWHGDPWYFTLSNLNMRLLSIDPNYSIIQIKEKFGELRFYFRTSDASKRHEMDLAISNAARICREIDQQKKTFDQHAVPVSPTIFFDL